MQIVETSNDGLKRAYAVTIKATDIDSRVQKEVAKMAPQVRMAGFRPGKVPANLVRKMHGPALLQEALSATIREATDKTIRDNRLRPAMQPQVTLAEGYAEGQDAALAIELEVLPEITLPSLEGLALEKLVVPVTDAQVDDAAANVAAQQKSYSDAPDGAEAAEGDQLTIDFVGKIDGVAFAGGTAQDQALVLGAGRFIPGFEEQLVGARAGEERQIKIAFPEDYGAKELAGKEATFDITVKAVKNPGEAKVDEDFAKSLGLESLDQLKDLLRRQLEQETAGLTRTQMKRALLDQLAAGHEFAVPPSMVEAEFGQMWQHLQQEAARETDPDAARAELEAEKEEYRRIAERRVRLGLLLSEIGQANGVEVSAQEMDMLIGREAQRYGAKDRERFIEYVRSEPLAAAQLRAPLYEDKVVDFLFDKATVTEREVTMEELQAAIEAEEAHVHGPDCDHDHAPAAPAQKPRKRSKAEASTDEAPAQEAPKKAAKAKPAAAEGAAEKRAKKPAATKKPAAETAPAQKSGKKA